MHYNLKNCGIQCSYLFRKYNKNQAILLKRRNHVFSYFYMVKIDKKYLKCHKPSIIDLKSLKNKSFEIELLVPYSNVVLKPLYGLQ